MSKVWLITGSSRGFGKSLAQAVLENGDFLLATARKPEQLQELSDKWGNRVHPFALDVTSYEQAQAAVQEALRVFGRLDVVVNNAGYGNLSSIEQTEMDDFRDQMETNLFGTVHVTKAALPVFVKQGSGHFIQFSSIGGRLGGPGLSAYQSAKWAVEGFSEVLHKEVSPLGIHVTLIEPGGFRTDWAGSSMSHNEPAEAYRDTVGAMIRHAREYTGRETGDPDKAARAILRIAEESAPPLRLLLGSDAYALALKVDQDKITETERWKELTLSTDFADGEVHPIPQTFDTERR